MKLVPVIGLPPPHHDRLREKEDPAREEKMVAATGKYS